MNFSSAAERSNLLLPFVLLGFSLILICVYTATKQSKLKELISKLIGIHGLPIFGNAFIFAVPTHEIIGIIKFVMSIYGPVIRGRLGKRRYVFVADPDVTEKVLSSSAHIEKSEEYKFLEPWLGTGLLTASGEKWRRRRKLLTPAFHFQVLDNFLQIFNEQSCTLVQILKVKAETGESFDICPYITRCALDIICETAMGEKINAQVDSDSEYVKAVYEISEMVLQRMTRPWLRPNFLWKLINGATEKRLLTILHGFTEKVIQKRKLERSTQKCQSLDSSTYDRPRKAFLDLLLDASDEGRLLSDLDIREETDTFMFEGHDTTAACLNFTIFLLASYPDCQRHVQEELEVIFGGNRNRFITMRDLSQMKYLECCIKESLRLFPSVPLFARGLTQDIKLENARPIRKGSIVFIIAFLLHRNPQLYPEPDKCKPERFFPEISDKSRKHPYAYVPFSAGPRNCIGQKFALMEMKVVLAQFFRNFRAESRGKLEELKLVPEVILRSKHGLQIALRKLHCIKN